MIQDNQSFETEIKQSKTKFKAILACFNDVLDGLIVRSTNDNWKLDPTIAVNVAIQLTAASFRESFKPYPEEFGEDQEGQESPSEDRDEPQEE